MVFIATQPKALRASGRGAGYADVHLPLCATDGRSPSFEAFELPTDHDIFVRAEALLGQHLSCDHVEVWQAERAVLALHRDQPVFRPIRADAA